MHVDSNQLVWNTIWSSSSNPIVTDHPPEDKRIQVDDPPPCPICGLDDRVQVKYTATLEAGGHYRITIGCDRCLIYMHELHPLLVQGVLSITEHWGRRPSRDDFSKALSRARAADRYDSWLEQQARELGPFTVEEMESFFDKCIYELILIIRDRDSQLGTASQAITSLRQVVIDLQSQIATRNKGLERGGESGNTGVYGGLLGRDNPTLGQPYGSGAFSIYQGLNKGIEDSKPGIWAELERMSLLVEQHKAEELRKNEAAKEALGQNDYPAGRKRHNKKR